MSLLALLKRLVENIGGVESIMAVRALVFDVFGTVVDWRSSVIEQLQSLGREKKLTLDWEIFVDKWHSCYRPGLDAVRDGSLPWTNVDDIYRTKLESLLCEYSIVGLSDAEKIRINRVWHRCAPWPDAVPGLTRLKVKYVLSTLSNGDVACLVNIAKQAGLPWDCVLCAELFHCYKPDSKVYRGAIKLLGLEPPEIMMVAAHNYDLRAARLCGMGTAFVPRPKEYGRYQTAELSAEEDWDVIASNFEELAAALQT
jgi:2-haloacid dehalogenase